MVRAAYLFVIIYSAGSGFKVVYLPNNITYYINIGTTWRLRKTVFDRFEIVVIRFARRFAYYTISILFYVTFHPVLFRK